MISVTPEVYLLSEPQINWTGPQGAAAWLEALGADPVGVKMRMSGSDAEQVIELAARRCYKSFEVGLNPNVTRIREDSKLYHENVLKSSHGSVMEHANFTMAFEFVSRVFTHELVRHRAGCSYSQESLRYVRLTELGFWIPPEIAANPVANQVFIDTIAKLEKAQLDILLAFEQVFHGEDFAQKKKLTSAFRRIAPDGLATGIVATFNARAFRHLAELRTSRHAEVEIRLAIGKACDILFLRHPYLFQDFEEVEFEGMAEMIPKYKKV